MSKVAGMDNVILSVGKDVQVFLWSHSLDLVTHGH
jgi:hypothetical protein